MKTIGWLLTLFIISGWSCNSSSGKTVSVASLKDDSLDYYPPTPVQMDRQLFRHYFREVSAFFETRLVNRGFSGGILIAKDGYVVYEKYAGITDRVTRQAFTDSTPTHIASSGKTFTGTAILRLVQEGKLTLDDPLENFFPGFPYTGINVRMLLNHRSGLPNYLYFMPKNEYKDHYVTNADVLNYLLNKKPNRSYAPGKKFSYCNTNYVLLALIIEQVSGKSYPEYMRTKFFEPLGMTHTFVYTGDTTRVITSFAANGTVWDNDHLEGTYGDKNIYTTPRDLLKWDQALYTDQVLGAGMEEQAFTPYSNERPSIHNYGLGWRLLMIPNGKKVIYHNGRWHGFNAAFARLTDERVTIIVLGNKYNSGIYRTARESYDLFGDYKQTREGFDEEADDNSADSKKTTAVASPKTKNKG